MNEIVLQLINYWVLTPVFVCLRFLVVLLVLTCLRRLWVHKSKKGQVSVVVLGDIGRSPRMQYHSLSLASNGYKVCLIGFSGSVPHYSILDCNKIHLRFTKEAHSLVGVPKVLSYVTKVVLQTLYLLWTLNVHVGASEYILLQNPPCIPSLAVCWLMSIWNGSKLVVDWHNYGYSILALSVGKLHPLVKIARWYEEIFGQLSFGHLCVTKALENDLMQRWNISAEVMHDRPTKIFKSLSDREKHNLFLKLSSTYSEFQCDSFPNATKFTRNIDGKISFLENRPALIISSTSWTEDEDFSILLQALLEYDKMIEKDGRLPNVLCAITGKGPQKSYYQEVISSTKWKHVNIVTPWLEAEDYPKLLACADLGVSLHTSSSGLDLPMKVVDMFGCGLPVAAINFACLDELVRHNENGVVFKDARELSEQFVSIFRNFPKDTRFLDQLRTNLEKFRKESWENSWNKIVLPLFKK